MFSSGVSYSKLKTNLRLAMNRLKLSEKKKTELALKARKEIADYIAADKVERARIRVEYIIREDYLVEAMEIVEMYCDLLLARFGMVQQMRTLDDGLSEAVSSLIWAAPRLQTDIAELKVIADQLTLKYGQQFSQAVLDGSLATVNKTLQNKLAVVAPPRHLVEQYLVEIAKSRNVNYEPDPELLKPPAPESGVDVAYDLLGDDTNIGPCPPAIFPMPAVPPPHPYPGYFSPGDPTPSLPSYEAALRLPHVDFSTSSSDEKKEPLDHDTELERLNQRFEALKKL